MPSDEEMEALFNPTDLTEEAIRPATPSLLDRLNAPEVKRPRGRPPGSRNKPKPNYGQVGQGLPSELVVPGRPTSAPKGKDEGERDLVKEAAAKKAKAEAYTKRILEEANDNIMLIIISLGIPQGLLYKPGKAPAAAKVDDEKYTEFGSSLAIKPAQARALASFAAELEFTPGGARLAASAGTGYGPLLVKGLFAVGAGVQYVRGLSTIRQQLEPALRQMQAYRAQAEQHQDTNGKTKVGGLT